ncbi:unnamed protein product [Rhodiola kirilowii]
MNKPAREHQTADASDAAIESFQSVEMEMRSAFLTLLKG